MVRPEHIVSEAAGEAVAVELQVNQAPPAKKTPANAVACLEGKGFWRVFLAFLWPLILTNILQNLAGTINTIYVGQMLGVDAVAAVSMFMPIMFLMIAFVIGLSAGTTVIVGQAFGAKDHQSLLKAVGASLFLSVVLGLILAIAGMVNAKAILLALGTAPEIIDLALPYFYTMMAACPLTFCYILYTSVLRGVGDSRSPLIALGATIFMGLLITPLLIKAGLGTMSPAVANVLGNIGSLYLLHWLLNRKQHSLAINKTLLHSIRFDAGMSLLVVRIGVPAGLQMMVASLASLVILRLINQFGAQATAAYGALSQVLNYIQFPALSIAIAASIFAAQAIGAGKPELVGKITRFAQQLNVIITGGLIVLAYLYSRHLMALFITDDKVVATGQSLLFVVLWSVIFFGANAILNSVMRASGTVWRPLLINVGALLLIELPVAYVLSNTRLGLHGIWVGYACAFVFGSLVMLWFYKKVWQKKPLVGLLKPSPQAKVARI